MTGKKSSLIVGGVVVIGIVLFMLVSAFTNSPLPIINTPPILTCAEQGLDTDPADPTQCIPAVATTTSTTTPPVPTPTRTPKPTTVGKFDTQLLLTTTESLTFSDGLTVTLATINDSRCKPDVQCIWAGELAPEFSVTGGAIGTDIQKIALGTVRNTSATVGAYTLTLVTATEDNTTITISKKAVSQNNGAVSGTVTIGPICPVERIDEPCVIPSEVYTSRNVIVYGPTEDVKISQTKLSADGTFNLSLSPGAYWLQIDPAGIGPGEKKPVTVSANKTSTVDFDIDTGIR
jgi:hypothetical protein